MIKLNESPWVQAGLRDSLLTKSKEWETPERDTHELQSREHWSLFSVLDPSRKMQLTFILVFLVAVSQMSLKSMSFNPVTSPLWLWPRAGLWERNLGSISFPAEAQCRTPEWSWILVSAAWRGKTGQPKKNTYARNRKLKVRCWEYQRVQGPRRMVRDVYGEAEKRASGEAKVWALSYGIRSIAES